MANEEAREAADEAEAFDAKLNALRDRLEASGYPLAIDALGEDDRG